MLKEAKRGIENLRELPYFIRFLIAWWQTTQEINKLNKKEGVRIPISNRS